MSKQNRTNRWEKGCCGRFISLEGLLADVLVAVTFHKGRGGKRDDEALCLIRNLNMVQLLNETNQDQTPPKKSERETKRVCLSFYALP